MGKSEGKRRKPAEFEFDSVPRALRERSSLVFDRLSLALRKQCSNALAALELTQRQYAILCCLDELSPACQTNLSIRTGIDRADHGESLAGLAQRLLISLDVDDDRRPDEIRLTWSGEQLLVRAHARLDGVESQAFGKLSAHERSTLRQLAARAMTGTAKDQARR